MKLLKLNILVVGCISALLFTGCSSFLEETSQDEIIPETLQDLTAVMYKEAYPYLFSGDNYISLLTDEMVSNGVNADNYLSFHQNGAQIFTYNSSMYDGAYNLPKEGNSWVLYYEKIKGCNVVLDYVSEIQGASETEINAMRGQALFLRGYYYLKLATLYCQPYSDDSEALGLPLVLSMNVTDVYPTRASLKATFDQIELDLKASIELLKNNFMQPNAYRVGYLTAEAMLTRYYLYKNRKEDLQKIIDYGSNVIKSRSALTYLNLFENQFHYYGVYDLEISEEALWAYGVSSLNDNNYGPSQAGFNRVPYSVSPLLTSLYEQNDLRAQAYFWKISDLNGEYNYRSNKVGIYTSGYGDRGIRNAEVYLNRAEAYCRLFLETGDDSYRINALDDLNTLRESRYAADTYVDLDITDAQELLDFCLEERRRELCLEEGLRWADIKRLNLSVTHVFKDQFGSESTYELEAGDLLYALPIPYNVIQRNPELSQNPR